MKQLKALLLTHGIKIIAILIIWLVLHYFTRKLLSKFFSFKEKGKSSEGLKRVHTIYKFSATIADIFYFLIFAIVLLKEFGIEIGPMLAGLGVAGVAAGIGAQDLIKDIIGGFFIITEDVYRIGDSIEIEGNVGTVESITMRITRLRNFDGGLITIPNGQIRAVKNNTRGWSRVILKVSVAYRENLDRVIEVTKSILLNIWKSEHLNNKILEQPEVLGVNDLQNSGVEIMSVIKTLPGEQWSIGREARKRIKEGFDRAGIEIPFPQITIHFKKEGT